MRQLTSLDAQFLALENARTQGHVSVLGVYDPITASDRSELSVLGCGRTTTTYPKKKEPSSQFLTYDPRMTAAGAAVGGR